jgi:hypothetical protein
MNASGGDGAMNASGGDGAMDASSEDGAMDASIFQRLLPFAFQGHSMERGAVSRVRFAAQTSRALDTAPSFPTNPTEKKAKGRISESGARLSTGEASLPCQTHNLDLRRH